MFPVVIVVPGHSGMALLVWVPGLPYPGHLPGYAGQAGALGSSLPRIPALRDVPASLQAKTKRGAASVAPPILCAMTRQTSQ